MRQVLSSGSWSARRVTYSLTVMSAKAILEACKAGYTFQVVADEVFDAVSAEAHDLRKQLLNQT